MKTATLKADEITLELLARTTIAMIGPGSEKYAGVHQYEMMIPKAYQFLRSCKNQLETSWKTSRLGALDIMLSILRGQKVRRIGLIYERSLTAMMKRSSNFSNRTLTGEDYSMRTTKPGSAIR